MWPAGVVDPDRHHVHVDRRRDLGREQRPRVDVRDPVEVLLVVLHRIDAVERERREQRDAHDGLAHGRDARRVLVAQQVAAQPRLGPLGVLEFHDRRPLDRLLADAEQPRGHLGDHVVLVGNEPLRIAALARAGEPVERLGHPRLAQQGADVGRAERHAAAVPGDVDRDLGPGVAAAIEQQSASRCLPAAGRREASPGSGTAGGRSRRPKPRPRSPGAFRAGGRFRPSPRCSPADPASSGSRPSSRRPDCRTATAPAWGQASMQ